VSDDCGIIFLFGDDYTVPKPV